LISFCINRERVYAYELYHQLLMQMAGKVAIFLAGDDKTAIQLSAAGCWTGKARFLVIYPERWTATGRH